MYCKFSVILWLNILIRLYLIKYALICTHILKWWNSPLKKTRFKIILAFVDIFNEKTLPEWIMDISFFLRCKSENSTNSLKLTLTSYSDLPSEAAFTLGAIKKKKNFPLTLASCAPGWDKALLSTLPPVLV